MRFDFGAKDFLTCSNCGKHSMGVTRRSPHPQYGIAFEMQTLTCLSCKNELTRAVDRLGRPVDAAVEGRASPPTSLATLADEEQA